VDWEHIQSSGCLWIGPSFCFQLGFHISSVCVGVHSIGKGRVSVLVKICSLLQSTQDMWTNHWGISHLDIMVASQSTAHTKEDRTVGFPVICHQDVHFNQKCSKSRSKQQELVFRPLPTCLIYHHRTAGPEQVQTAQATMPQTCAVLTQNSEFINF
jgi:hypothetical protein